MKDILKNKKVNLTFMLLNMALLFFMWFELGILQGINEVKKVEQEVSDVGNISDNKIICQDLPLINTSLCLNRWVNTFYKYTETEDSIRLTFDDLKEKGGDCKDWSELYLVKGKELGFKAKYEYLRVTNETAHRYTILWDETGYCTLDQRKFSCFTFRNS